MKRYYVVLYGVWFSIIFAGAGAAAWWHKHNATVDDGDATP